MTMTLPAPHFIDRDATEIERRCIAFLESPVTGLGRPLSPSGVERHMLSLLVYELTLLRIGVQEAAKQNLPAFARFPMIDYLVAIAGGGRLPAQSAKTVVEWTTPAPVVADETVPAGTAVRSKDGKVTFVTDADLVIAAGETHNATSATATVAGELANGYGVGQISVVVPVLPFAVSASNIATTAGGSPSESSDKLKARLPLIVRGTSIAGPEDSYVSLARGAHPDVLEVAVDHLGNGQIRIVVLARTGAPSSPVLNAVEAACSSKIVRPMSDAVTAVGATPLDYVITAAITLRKNAPETPTMAAVQAAAEAYRDERAGGLGRSLVPSQIVAALSVENVYSVALSLPAATTVPRLQWARCTAINLTVAGFATGD